MNSDEIRKITALADCVLRPASFTKRFVRGMEALVHDSPDYLLSDRQWYTLETLYHSHREQIQDHERYCIICKALSSNTPLIDLVCPGCGFLFSVILKPRIKSINDDHVCPRCMQFKYSGFELRRKS